MTEMSELMDKWMDWHAHFGTRIARDWVPTPTPEAAIQAAVERVGGPPWPEEVLDLYRWSQGSSDFLFPFGTFAPLESVSGGENDLFLGYEDIPDSQIPSPYSLFISHEYPCTYVDRVGQFPGQVWAMDVGDLFFFADSLLTYMEGCIRLAERGEFARDESGSYLAFADGRDSRRSPQTGNVERELRPASISEDSALD